MTHVHETPVGDRPSVPLHNMPRRAPELLQRFVLEWLYRAANEPGRLSRRYFWNNPRFLTLAALRTTGLCHRHAL